MVDTLTKQQNILLTTIEQKVLGLVARGLVNSEIARALNMSTSTVKSHLHEIFQKLRARNRAQAVILALTHRHLAISEIYSPEELAALWASLDQETIEKVAELVKRIRENDRLVLGTE